MKKDFDFSGWATKANMLCSDGRVIMKDAFKECDGVTVPLIWNHDHNQPEKVLGHALLENRDDGVYAYCTFNDTESGKTAKLLVQHGDVDRLSIYANRLKQRGSEVLHGIIREVSLVLAGANPGAQIETVIEHDDESGEGGYIRCGDFIDVPSNRIEHAEDSEAEEKEEEKQPVLDKKEIKRILGTLNPEQEKAVYATIGMVLEEAKASEDDSVKHSDEKETDASDGDSVKNSGGDKSVEDVLKTLNPEQQKAVYAIIGMILEEGKLDADDDEDTSESKDEKSGDVKHSDEEDENSENDNIEGGNNTMKTNVFDKGTDDRNEVLTHAEMVEILDDAKKTGSLKEAVIQHGIENIDYLFPDAQAIDKTPGFIKRDDTWVSKVMNGVHKTPFSRIKSIFADLTEADARAKGYIKGNMKAEEFFGLIKRITTPTTIYKKQRIDRDDVIDITDFDVVAWLKTEMRMMLDEEIARGVLVGDGRSASSNDKINEQNLRPIWTDDDVYTVKVGVNVTSSTTADQRAKAFIKACVKSRKNYKGSGNPSMFITEDMLTDCLLLEDANGRVIYDTVDKLATALRVREIIPVPVMEDLTREVGDNTHTLEGIYVNLNDYNIGADKGGAVNMFDDFDIDYNQQKYLIETRCSGALTKPYSAVAIEAVQKTSELS